MSTEEVHDMEQIAEVPDVTTDAELPATKQRWGATNVVLAVGIVVGLVAATTFLVLALGAGSDADDARQRTDALRHRMIVLQERATAAERRRDHLIELRDAAARRAEELGIALGASEEAQNSYVDVTNRAAAQHNAGDPDGATATFRGDGQAAFERLAERVAAADRALVAVQAAIDDLEEELR
jgi:hypothetical protein